MPPMRPPFVPGGGGGGAASTVIWSVDFSGEADHNFKATAALSLGGVTWTADNAANASVFSIASGVLNITPNISNAWVTTTLTAPRLVVPWADLMAAGAKSGAYDNEKSYTLRIIHSSAISPPAGGSLVGIRTGTSAGKDVTMELNGTSWRIARAGSGYNFMDNQRSTTAVTGAVRSMAVVYAQGTFRTLASTSATHEGEAFGGEPIYAGFVRKSQVGDGGKGMAYIPAPGTPYLDLTLAAAEAFVGAWWWNGSSPGAFLIERIELHEVG